MFAFIKLCNIFLKKIQKNTKTIVISDATQNSDHQSTNVRFSIVFGSFLAYICCHIRVSNFPPEYFPAEIIINGKNSGGKDFCRKSFQANFFLGISGFRRRISGSNGFKSNVVNQALLSLHGSNLRLHSPFKLKGSVREK